MSETQLVSIRVKVPDDSTSLIKVSGSRGGVPLWASVMPVLVEGIVMPVPELQTGKSR